MTNYDNCFNFKDIYILLNLNSLHNCCPIKRTTDIQYSASIHATLALSGNQILIKKIRKLQAGVKIRAITAKNNTNTLSDKDIREARNAIKVYRSLDTLDFQNINDFYKAHRLFFDDEDIPNIEDDKKAELESLFKWLKKSTCNKYAISIIVFIEILRIHPFFDGNGRMSRLWLRIMLTNIDNQLSNISFEKEFFDNRTFYSNIISSHKDQEDLTLFIEVMLLKLLALKANHQEKVDTSDLEAYGRKGFNDWYSDEYISRAMESQVVKDLFQNIQTLGKNSDLEEEEKQKLKADLLGISIANYMEYDELITINSILRDHHLGGKIDLLYLLSLVIEGRNQFHRFEKRKADWLFMQNITEAKQKKNKELKNELHVFQCCCLYAHNLNIKNHYKGNGPGSGRSILLSECEFLKEKFNETPHKFNKLCRDFESKLSKNQADEILNASEYCCPIYSSSEDDKKTRQCAVFGKHELI